MAHKLLIVDDDLYIRELYEEVLKDAGYDVSTAVDGEDGLSKLKQGGYELVLLDVMMPKLDGLGVLQKLSELSPKPTNGPIILLTNLSHDPIINEAMQHGASTYMIKADVTPDQLLAKVKEIVK